jgi:CheY-like chemotaxis protein
VLFVDDEEDLRDVFAAVFARDFEIVCAASGPEALEKLDDGFSVLVTDMRMQPMHGAELLRRAFERHPDTAISRPPSTRVIRSPTCRSPGTPSSSAWWCSAPRRRAASSSRIAG